jgi:ribosomal protein S18 acetylase RimI-like enzyme
VGYLVLGLDGGTAGLGRLFASRQGPTHLVESILLFSAIEGAFSLPGVERFSGEILMLSPLTTEWLLREWPEQVGLRCLMEIDEIAVPGVPPLGTRVRLGPWRQDLLLPAASLLKDAYAAVADAWSGLDYGTIGQARAVLESISSSRFCGLLEPGASFAATDALTGELLGFVQACRMGLEAGHIAQLAVAPGMQGQGLGAALLVGALKALRALGCRTIHLLVHKDNAKAVGLYQKLGFRERHSFPHLRLERNHIRT